jgi:serine/threonine protein kinase
MILLPGERPIRAAPDYQLVQKRGSGAFGEVWQAEGPGGIGVALKFILLDARQFASELRSLEAMRDVRHPNLVSLFGVWVEDNRLILAMELCDRSLEDRLAETLGQGLPGIPLDELLSYMHDAANGLVALNAKNVLHRDVKPANLLLLNSGVKVADFGLAKALEQTVATNSGGGTFAYLAPECFKGELARQSDQYSLAVTYYHLRTGCLLFQGNQAEVMYAHLQSAPNLSALPAAERLVLARALSKEPSTRWSDCKRFVEELGTTAGGDTSPRSRGQARPSMEQRPRIANREEEPFERPGEVQAAPRAFRSWEPSTTVTDHNGSQISEDADFFHSPPVQIGRILTAHSTLNRGQLPMKGWVRSYLTYGVGIACWLIGLSVLYSVNDWSLGWVLIFLGAIPVAGAFGVWRYTAFNHTVTYVGVDGVARINCRGGRNQLTSEEFLRFADATELRTSEVRHFQNGGYQHTTYDFDWSNEKRQKLLSVSGTYRSKEGKPDAGSAFWFASSAETAWSMHFWKRAQVQLKSDGYLNFALSATDFVRLSPASIVLRVGGEEATIKAHEIGSISLGGGQLEIRHKNAKTGFLGFGRSGIFTFSCASLANARLFFLALERLMGPVFQSPMS